jgi:hypothetical protein
MAGEDETPPPPPQQPGQVKLAVFWPQAPALWFAQAECTFAVKRVVAQFDRYCHMVAALPHESIRLVADIVEGEPSETPYNNIKQRLVASHQLSDFQKAERLFQMPALGCHKLSELMAAMLKICPRGEEKTNLFACIFLQRLPRDIRVLLSKANHKDPKTLATQADELRALHDTTNGGGGVAAIQETPDSDFVATISGDRRRGGDAARWKTCGGRRGRGGKATPGCRSQRLPRRPGWPPGSASSTGDMERAPLPVSSPATGRETAVPGATKTRSSPASFFTSQTA